MTLIVHISDLHFGPPIRWDRVAALQDWLGEADPDAVVVSGDIVQRATFPSQFIQAREFLRGLAPPRLCVPGNHEIALLNPMDRLLQPYHYYRRYIHSELEPALEVDRAVVMGLNSTKPYLIHNGWISGRQLTDLGNRSSAYPNGVARLVATHHPLLRIAGYRGAPQYQARRTLLALSKAGIDIVLSGHFHASRVLRASEQIQGLSREVYVLLCGSTTSDRVGRSYQGGNFFHTIEVTDGSFLIRSYLFNQRIGFELETEERLSRAKGL